MIDIRFDGKLDYLIDDIGFVNVLRNAGFTFPYKNGKEKFSLIFVENGEINYYFTQNKENVKLIKGSTLLIPKYTPNVATYNQDNTIAKVITFDVISDNIPSMFNTTIYKNDVTLAEISNTISGKKANSTIFLASKIYELLYLLEQEKVVIPDKYKKIIPALEEIQNRYYENKKLSYYADMCYMSESNFRKLFKEYTGKSPVEYRNLIRIAEAKKLIDSKEFSVSEAAYLSSFNNMSFFYEIYNKTLGKHKGF